jgi:hypothetical protein
MADPKTYEGNGHSVTVADPENITQDECLELARSDRDAWNAWRKQYPVRRVVTTFILSFENTSKFFAVDFSQEFIDFNGFIFGDGATFQKSKFLKLATFIASQWGDQVDLSEIDWGEVALFNGAQFGLQANFSNSKWDKCFFDGAQFGADANFDKCMWQGIARFRASNWARLEQEINSKLDQQWALERGLAPDSFSGISFRGARFCDAVDFSGRHFQYRAEFSPALAQTDSTNALKKILGHHQKHSNHSPSLENKCEPDVIFTSFAKAPLFFDCKFPQNITFESVDFPEASGTELAARTYRTLKLAFAQQQAIREEQRFFKLEMEEEAAREKGSRRWLHRAYKYTSDFGFSVSRPLIGMTLSMLATLLLYAWQAGLTWASPQQSTHFAVLVQFSIASALPGFEKLAGPVAQQLFGAAGNGSVNYSVWTVITLLAHKALSLLFLFLAGLALRNLFKMK